MRLQCCLELSEVALKVELNEIVDSRNFLSSSTGSSWQDDFNFLESLCCCFSSCSTDMLLLFSSHIFFMRGAVGAALSVCLFWLPLIEVSSLMTPHKTDHPYGVDSVWAS